MELKIEYLGVNDLTPYERNTRRHESRDVDEIVKSIERYGFDDPIGVWGDRNVIVEGHGRLLAAKILGMQTVRSKDHPTMKPVGLVGYQMRNSSKRGDLVLDLFGGSGSTLIAAEQLRRKCYMMEYDPRYVDVIIKRWEEYTGKKARLLK